MRAHLFDHIDLRVTNIVEADLFYRTILPTLGFPIRILGPGGISYDSLREHAKAEFISLIEDAEHRPNATRIAFWGNSKAEVDEFASTLSRVSARNVEGPMYCSEYISGYYAVFFEDPCGNRLEVCCRDAEPKATG
jgi:hypothetical protein